MQRQSPEQLPRTFVLVRAVLTSRRPEARGAYLSPSKQRAIGHTPGVAGESCTVHHGSRDLEFGSFFQSSGALGVKTSPTVQACNGSPPASSRTGCAGLSPNAQPWRAPAGPVT